MVVVYFIRPFWVIGAYVVKKW